jgi:secondary thiamine-phosphate synthase enzyme
LKLKSHYEEIKFKTKVDEVVDITGGVAKVVGKSGLRNGVANVFCIGSTSAVTTMEYEDGLVEDLGNALQRLLPREIPYEHERRWHDGNGHSHVRSSFLGPSIAVPFTDGNLVLGTWQQIIFLELDARNRDRRVAVQVIGE